MDHELFYPVVIVPYEGPLTERLGQMGIDYKVIPRAKLISTSAHIRGKKVFNPFAVIYDVLVFIPTIWDIRNYLKREEINIVHTNSMVAHIYGAAASRLASVPCVWHMQDIVDQKMALGLVRKCLVWFGGSLPKKIVVVSKAVGAMFNGKSVSKIHVIYNGTDCKKFSPEVDGSAVRKELGIAEKELVVGIVGRLTQWKGQKEFLEAAAIVSEHIPNVRFLVVGDTTFGNPEYKNELYRLAARTGLSSRVIFTGFRTDVSELIAAMDLCVLSSILPDPCPLVLFDYMAAAKAVVATKFGGVPEILEHGRDGLLIDPRQVADFAGKMIALLKDESLRMKISEAARNKILNNFTVERFVEQFEQLYCEIVH